MRTRSATVAALLLLATALAPARAEDAPPQPPLPPAPPPPAPPTPSPPPDVPDPGLAGPAKAFTVDFETWEPARALPEGFVVALGAWKVVDDPEKPGKNHVLLQDKPSDPWAVALATGAGRAFGDGRVSVRFQPVTGRDDMTGGVVVRARDATTYYLARANALEDNLRLYAVVGGVRWQLASTTVVPPKAGAWHTLEVEARGETLRAVLDGKDVVEAKDKRLASGWVGLWTKADSVTRFDDLVVSPDEPPKEDVPAPAAPAK